MLTVFPSPATLTGQCSIMAMQPVVRQGLACCVCDEMVEFSTLRRIDSRGIGTPISLLLPDMEIGWDMEIEMLLAVVGEVRGGSGLTGSGGSKAVPYGGGREPPSTSTVSSDGTWRESSLKIAIDILLESQVSKKLIGFEASRGGRV